MAQDPGSSPTGEAFTWAARLIAVGLVMFLPAVGGRRLDALAGTAWMGPAGLVLGFVAGLAWLVRIARDGGRRRGDP